MVARVMNNFSLKDLIIINPRENWLNDKSINSAKKASNIINKVKIYNNLDEALKKFTYVIAMSNRARCINKSFTNNFINIKKILNTSNKVAIIFGPENSGLSNEDLQLADLIFSINTNNNSNSLNLSHAVTIISHKIFEFNESKNKGIETKKNKFVNKDQLSKYFDFLFKNLSTKNFFVPKEKKRSMLLNINNLIYRLEPNDKELRILGSIISSLSKKKAKR